MAVTAAAPRRERVLQHNGCMAVDGREHSQERAEKGLVGQRAGGWVEWVGGLRSFWMVVGVWGGRGGRGRWRGLQQVAGGGEQRVLYFILY